MNLYAVIYLKGQLVAAMFLWPGATVEDCERVNSRYADTLPASEAVTSGAFTLDDIHLDCERHATNPVSAEPATE